MTNSAVVPAQHAGFLHQKIPKVAVSTHPSPRKPCPPVEETWCLRHTSAVSRSPNHDSVAGLTTKKAALLNPYFLMEYPLDDHYHLQFALTGFRRSVKLDLFVDLSRQTIDFRRMRRRIFHQSFSSRSR